MLNEKPVPTNILKSVKLEKYYTEFFEVHLAKRELALDGMFQKMQTKTLSIIGPLRKL